MSKNKWIKELFESILDDGKIGVTAGELHKYVWDALNNTSDRQRFSFGHKMAIKHYFTINGGAYYVNKEALKNFPTLIEKYNNLKGENKGVKK